MAVNARTRCLVDSLRSLGIQHPHWTIEYARKYGLPISLLASVLLQESSGGHNVFGHDPPHGIGSRLDAPRLRWLRWIQGRRVTRRRYLRYKRYRQKGYGMQGVGPMQLTWYAFQDQADRQGGTWHAEANIRYGAAALAQNLRGALTAETQLDGIAAYNGGGTAARTYARQVKNRGDRIHGQLQTRCP